MQITTENNDHLQTAVSTQTACLKLDFTRRLHQKTPTKNRNVAKHLEWSKKVLNWALAQIKNVIFYDESYFTLFPNTD